MEVNIEGVPITFPFQPYGIQLSYMRSVIKALQNKQNALLESPTGTGKTLSLLCSTLAWLETKKNQISEALPLGGDDKNYSILNETPTSSFVDAKEVKGKQGKRKGWKNGEVPIRIIYSSRTHLQLSQACKELKNSSYSHISSVTLGSREQMCINPQVTKLDTATAKNQSCRQKVKSNECSYSKTYEEKMQDLNLEGTFVYDIEDMVDFGNKNKCCPYYTARAKSNFNTSLIFMPYNYVIDPKIRQTLKLEFQNSVIIFDEGHNIEQVCEDAMSAELKAEWLALSISVLDNALSAKKLIEDGQYDGMNEGALEEIDIHDLAKAKMLICDLETECDNLVRNTENGKGSHQPEALFKIFQIIGMDFKAAGLLAGVADKLLVFVMASSTNYMINASVSALTSVCAFVEMLVPLSKEGVDMNEYKKDLNKNYKVHTELDAGQNNSRAGWRKKSEKNWTINLWCLSPSVAIKSLLNLGVYSILITSGTLAPLESFESEMGVPFPIKLQNAHVIKRTQLSIQMVFKDPNGMDLAASFERRNDNKYYQGLGLSVIELCRVIPKGVFIFFSSYSAINKSIEVWQSGNSNYNIYNSIASLKQIFIEPRGRKEFSTSIEEFRNACDTTRNGAIFMAVSRGKLSEGIDLRDDFCRAVIIIGLPYPARYDPRVELKQNYLNEQKNQFPGALSGMQWYMLQMKRALNQAVGRVVRHRNDFGAIIIFDSRFQKLNDGLSKWIQPFVARDSFSKNFLTNVRDIQSFFKVSAAEVGKPLIKIDGDQVSKPKSKAPTFVTPHKKPTDDPYNETFEAMRSAFAQPGASSAMFNAASKNSQRTPSKSCSSLSDSIFSALESSPSGTGSHMKRKEHSNPLVTSAKQNDNLSDSLSDSKKKKISFEKKADYFKDENYSALLEDFDDTELVNISVPKKEEKCQNLCDQFDFETAQVQSNVRDVFKTDKHFEMFNDILRLIQNQDERRYRQFIETIEIFGKKRNPQYLALRLNYLFDFADAGSRTSMMKRISELVKPNEKKLFLKLAKVDS